MKTLPPFKPLAFALTSFLLILGCSQARKIARTAEQAGDFKKQAATVLAQIDQNDFTWPEWSTTKELLAPFQQNPPQQDEKRQGIFATIITSEGHIELQLAYRLAPQASGTFLRLAKKGSYNRFQRPSTAGAATYLGVEATNTVATAPISPEFSQLLQFRQAGILAMPAYGKFLITLAQQPQFYGQYPAFGKVLKGLDIAQSLGPEDRILNIQIQSRGASAKDFEDRITQNLNQNLAQTLPVKLLYQRHGIAAIHQRLAQDFATVNWPRIQAQKLQRSKLSGAPNTWPNQQAFWGVQYKTLDKGSGLNLRDSGAQRAEIKYAAWVTQKDAKTILLDDILRGDKTLWINLTELLPAWRTALLEMKRGERRLLVLPPEGMYGILGNGPKIPAWSYIIMDIILVEYRSN